MNEKDKAIAQAMASIQNRLRHVYNQGFEDGRKTKRKTSKWIPVTEQLPEKADSYLVTYLDESGVYAGLVEFVECAYWTGLRWQKDCDDLEDVIAWMPLPEPYKEADE